MSVKTDRDAVLSVLDMALMYVEEAHEINPGGFKPGVGKRNAGDVKKARTVVAEAFETIDEGKRQWDQVAALLGIDGDDADGVIARAGAVAVLVAADRCYDDARFGLARARYNGEPLDVWIENCAKAEIRRFTAMAPFIGDHHG